MNKIFPFIVFVVVLDAMLIMNGVVTSSGTSLFYSVFTGNGIPGFSNSVLYSNMNASLTNMKIGSSVTIGGLVIAGGIALAGKTDVAIAAAIGTILLTTLPADLMAVYNILAVISVELATFIVAVMTILIVFSIFDWARTPLA